MFVLTDEAGYVTLAMEREVVLDDGSILVQYVTGMTEVSYSGDMGQILDCKLVDGVLVYDPTREQERQEAQQHEAEKQAERERLLLTLSEAFSETYEPSDKVGFLFKIVKLGEVEIMREYVTDPDHDPTGEDGTYLKPFTFTPNMEVIETKWYTNGEDIWECIKSGVCQTWADPEYFDVIA